MRGNKVPAVIDQLQFLQHLPNLRVLNLTDNPISQSLANYRMAVIKFLPHLDKLDDLPVSPLEV